MNAPASRGWFPFWFWNGRLTDAEIRWQVEQMAAQGLEGFIISPRQGLHQPYLSEEYFRLVKVAIDVARKHGLIVNIFDEFPYPSGAAGGELVLGNPQFFATAFVQQVFDVAGGPLRLELPAGKILNCTVCPLDGDKPQWEHARDVKSHIGVFLKNESLEHSVFAYVKLRYFTSSPIPTLEVELPAGPQRIFVTAQTTVEKMKYYRHFIDAMNPAAVRHFIQLTHERYRQHIGTHFGTDVRAFFTDETGSEWLWSDRVPAEFQKRCGYDLLPVLPALQDPRHPRHVEVAADLQQVKYEMFVEAFDAPISAWCRANRMEYWAEKPHVRLSHLKYLDVPGCDAGHTRAGKSLTLLHPGLRANARAIASGAYFYDKPSALCEAYHSMGWGATLQDIKRIADGLMIMGIDCFVPHAFYYSTHAMRKHDAAPSFFFQMPYWKFFGALVRHTRQVLDEIAGTHIAAEVLVVDGGGGGASREQQEDVSRAQHILLQEHIDFLLTDTDILEQGVVEAGTMRLRDLTVKLIVVPPMRRPEPALLAVLKKFEAGGGRVLRLAEKFNRERFVADVLTVVQPRLVIQGGDGIWCVTREGAAGPVWLVLNTSAQPVDAQFKIGTDAPFCRRLRPNEFMILRDSSPPAPEPVRVNLTGRVRVQPLHKNLLRLAGWDFSTEHTTAPVRVQFGPIINQLREAKVPFVPLTRNDFGLPYELSVPVLKVCYRTQFHCAYDGNIQLVVEPGSLAGHWRARLNAGAWFTESDLRQTDIHVRGSLAMDVTRFVQPGSNVIEVELETDRQDGGLVNPLYLAGDFGVNLKPLGICRRTEEGEFECYERNGLPFYAGVIEYTFDIDVPEATAIEFSSDPPSDEAWEVSINNGAWQALLWQPRVLAVPPGSLRSGKNLLKVRVYTTLIRAFDGEVFDTKHHRLRDVIADATS